MQTNRQYNALTGGELKRVIINEVERAIDNAGFNSMGVTFPLASWSWTLEVRQAESDIPLRTVTAGSQDDSGMLVKSLQSNSKKRFKTNPPSPTEVRQAEDFPIPER